MRKILLTFFCAILFSINGANAQYIGFETDVSSDWTTDNGARLSISDAHYKLGSQSLKWDWTQGSSLLINNPTNLKTAVSKTNGGLMLWIYNETPLDKKITFQFGTGSSVEYHFEYGINFKGWRACWIRFDEDMSGAKSRKDLDYMKIVAPTDVASGSLFFDRLKFPSEAIHDRVTPDKQLPYINPEMNSNHWAALWHWHSSYTHDINLEASVTTEQQNAFDGIESELLLAYKGSIPSSNKITATKSAFNAFNIQRTDGQITGRPYVSNDEYGGDAQDVKMIQVGPVLRDLAQIWYHQKDASIKQMFYDLLDYVMDQGLNVGSGMGTNHHYGYNFREFPPAIFLMKEALKADGRLDEATAMLSYWTGVQEYRVGHEVGTLQGVLDSWNTTVIPRLIAIATLDDSSEKAREMKAIIRWMDTSLKIVPGTMGGIKEDGSGFHHGGLYPAYSKGGFAGVGSFLRFVNGTCFSLSDEARINFGKALIAMRNYSVKYDWGFGVCGRHPLHGSISTSVKNAFAYLAKSGNPNNSETLWNDMAASYMRLESSNTSLKQEFAAKGISAEASPEGNFTYNYGALSIHRRDNWMVSIKGYNKHVWGSEIYSGDNRYGRYQSYGTVQVMNKQSAEASGFVQDGWDWNRYPGATSVHLPFDKLENPYSGTLMELSDETFAGGSNLFEENGIFGMKLNERNRTNFTADHQAKKSVFSFENRIVCLGTNVSNTNSLYNTETTLFQTNLASQSTGIYVDGTSGISQFPYNKTLDVNQNHWIIDPVGNGYWMRKGGTIKVSRSTQNSRHNKTKAATQGDFASAWIDHGKAPSNQSYEYVIIPNSSAADMQKMSTNMASEASADYLVLQQDGKAHIVWDRATNTTGYVFFEQNLELSNEFVQSVSAPSLVMLKASKDKTELSLSMCDPNLNFPEVAYTSAKPSQASIIELTLQGNWTISQTNSQCQILSKENGQTKLKFTVKDGIPEAIKLKKDGFNAIHKESFETAPGADSYAINTSFDTDNKNYFGRYEIANVSKYYLTQAKMAGVDQDWFIAGANVTQGSSTGPVNITLKEVNLDSYKNIKVKIKLGSLHTPPYKFDASSDSLFVEYKSNGTGQFKKIAAFYGFHQADHPWKGALGIDENFDGIADGGDDAKKYVESGLMKDFTFDVPEADMTSIQVRIRVSTDHYYEGVSIDDVRIVDLGDLKPQISLLDILAFNDNSAQFGLSSTSTGQMYWLLKYEGEAAPTAENIKKASGGVQSGNFEYITADKQESISLENLEGDYRLYAVIENSDGISYVKKSALLSIVPLDKQAPVISFENLVLSETKMTCNLFSDEDATLFWMVRKAEASVPTKEEVQVGTSAVSKGLNVAVSAKLAHPITVTNLEAGVSYVLYAVGKDEAENVSAVKISNAFQLKISEPIDDVDPEVTHFVLTDMTINSLTVQVEVNEAGTIFWGLVTSDKMAPNASEIEQGANSELKGSLNYLTENVETQFVLENIAANKSYRLYLVSKDKAGNYSSVIKSDEFSTFVTGIDDKLTEEGTQVYGIDNEIIIRSDRMLNKANLSVYSIDGRLVERLIFSGNSYRLQTNYQRGIYIVRLVNEGSAISKKILIK